jgi:hypothetical protein
MSCDKQMRSANPWSLMRWTVGPEIAVHALMATGGKPLRYTHSGKRSNASGSSSRMVDTCSTVSLDALLKSARFLKAACLRKGDCVEVCLHFEE